jgi:hypothetical protein
MAWYLSQSLGIESYDAPNNRTLYRTRVYLNASGNNSYSNYNTSGGGSVDGQGFSFTGPTAANLSNSGVEVYTGTFWVYGDAGTGVKGTVGASSYFQGSGGFSPGYITASASAGGFDFDRSPTTPSYTGITRSSDFTYFTITYTGGVNNNGPTPTYTLQYSTDNSSWTTYTRDGNNRVYLSSTTQYYFRLYASNADGTKYSSTLGPYYGIPSAPSSITATRTKRNITVTAGNSNANGGTAITAYKVQYSSDDGASWRTAQTMTSQSYTYTNLSASTTYLFRVFSTNASGDSTFTQTPSGTYMPVGGKRWNGTTFINPPKAQRWSGTSWVDLQTAKKWDGTAWIDLA